MKMWSRDFTRKEKALLLVLVIVLLGLAYYQFVDKPVRSEIAAAEAECASLQSELDVVQLELARLEKMQSELDGIEGASVMGSYNNSAAELKLLNDVLADTLQYTISFANVTRNGDQIRRDFTLQFKARDYDAMQDIVRRLCDGEYRCLVGDMRCSLVNDIQNYVTVNATATFYETMVGGTPDAGLPADSEETT